jgi:hypothetical protein
VAKSKLPNFRDSQVQARTGIIASAASGVLVLLLAFLVIENFNAREKTIGYSPRSLRAPAIYAATGLAGFLGLVGFGLGYSSLAQKRNMRQLESWFGLLIGAVTICLTIILFVFFKLFALATVT